MGSAADDVTSNREILISVDRDSEIPLNRQVYEGVREAVLRGRLQSGESLPASRRLADQLGLSRTVVVSAYELLIAEGYLETRHGSGTYVSASASALREPTVAHGQNDETDGVFDTGEPPVSSPVEVDFRHGLPACEAFPIERWQRSIAGTLARSDSNLLGYGPAEGVLTLRCEISRILRLTRAMPISSNEVLITTGATQALDLIARRVLGPGDVAVVEDPSHPILRQVFANTGAVVVGVPVDDQGLRVDLLDECVEASCGPRSPKLVYVTPSHQMPTGSIMSLSRRLALLDWATSNGTLVLEDDYDSDFCFAGTRDSAIAGLAPDRVAYVGSFSKSMFPALRIGFAVLPKWLRRPVLEQKWLTDRLTPAVEQQALAEFISSGSYAKHLSTMNTLYARRRHALLCALHSSMEGRFECSGEAAGLHVLLYLDSARSSASIARACGKRGVRVYPSDPFHLTPPTDSRPGMLLGFASVRESVIRFGVDVLADEARLTAATDRLQPAGSVGSGSATS